MGTWTVNILEYQSTETAEVGTSTTQIKITSHGLSPLDFIVNETRRSTGAERGCRLYHTAGGDADTIPLDTAITGQTSGDSIRLYKYVDRTGLMRPGTFRLTRRAGGKSTLSFEIKTDSSYILKYGQYVNVEYTSGGITSFAFKGRITSTEITKPSPQETVLFQKVECESYNAIPTYRTIKIDYPVGTSMGDIVTDMVDDYLFQEGIRKTTIDAGTSLEEEWTEDIMTIAEVLDQCAEKSGYQWFIDDEGLMTFYQDPGSIDDAVEDVDSAGAWKNYDNVVITGAGNYCNKVFVAGGPNENGDNVLIGSEDFDESTDQQERCAGTGVYGNVQRDSSIVETEFYLAESGTTTTNIKITGHGLIKGDVIWNYTRDAYRQVTAVVDANNVTVDAVTSQTGRTSDTAEAGTTTTNIKMTGHSLAVGDGIYNSTRSAFRFVLAVVDADNVTVEAVASQTTGDTIYRAGDVIATFVEGSAIIQNILKKESYPPGGVSFDTIEHGFLPGTKLKVNQPDMGVSNEYYLIEEVEIFDPGIADTNYWKARVKATKRKNANFSTQRSRNYSDFWGGF